MGQRANLILIEDGRQTIYYNHWCANTLEMDLFWGPDHATTFIRIQREVDESGWLDNVWAEGGAVMDHDHKVLLLFGGEDVLYDIPIRRVYLPMLRRVWQGWEIRWAHEGIADLADYVRYPRSNVLNGIFDRACMLNPPEQKDWTDLVVSVRFANGRQLFYPVPGSIEPLLGCGPDIVKECDRNEGYAALPLDEWISNAFVDGGICIDIGRQQLDYWNACDIPGIPDHVAQVWSGWAVNWHRDAFEIQLADGGGNLRFPAYTEEAIRTQLADQLLKYEAHNSAVSMAQIIDRLREEGKVVEQINPWALRDDRLEIPLEERQRIIKIALG